MQVSVQFSTEKYQQQEAQEQQNTAHVISSSAAEPVTEAQATPAAQPADADQLETGIRWPSATEAPAFWKRAPRQQRMTLGELLGHLHIFPVLVSCVTTQSMTATMSIVINPARHFKIHPSQRVSLPAGPISLPELLMPCLAGR